MSIDEIVNELEQGRAVKIIIEGEGASMRGVVCHGCVLTLSPVADVQEVQAGDIALVKWKHGRYIMHLVKEIEGDRYLIVNGFGKINGWVSGSDIVGRVTEKEDTGEQDIAKLVRAHEGTARTFVSGTASSRPGG